MKKAIKKFRNFGSVFLLSGSLMVASGAPGFLQPSINTNSLEEVLSQEKRKLGLDSINIQLTFGESPGGIASAGETEKGYKVILDGLKNKYALRHELYHIAKGHLSNKQTIPNLIKMEYQANVYALTGLKF